MGFFSPKLHRDLEKRYNLKKNVLKDGIKSLQTKHKQSRSEIESIVKECEEYHKANGNSIAIVFNMYVACLNNPPKNDQLD